jgi:RNA polymerase sigma-70 factor (ECF subfamily)
MSLPHAAADSDLPLEGRPAPGSRELALRIRAGDARAFEAVFRAHYEGLCRYAAAYLGSRDAAEDVVQGVFVRIWHDRERWDVHGDLGHYLFSAVRRRAMSHLRHDAVRSRAAPLLAVEGAARAPAATEAEVEAEELRRRLERALERLPPRTREAFVLSRGEGLSYDEVALRMGISPKTVGVHIGKSLALLRKAMLLSATIGLAGLLTTLR